MDPPRRGQHLYCNSGQACINYLAIYTSLIYRTNLQAQTTSLQWTGRQLVMDLAIYTSLIYRMNLQAQTTSLQWTGRQLVMDLAIYTSLIQNEPPRADNLSTMDIICALNSSIVERVHCVLIIPLYNKMTDLSEKHQQQSRPLRRLRAVHPSLHSPQGYTGAN